MQISQLGITKNKKTVVILGAGASRGAGCFRAAAYSSPLDADFFAQMQKVAHRDELMSNFLTFLREEFGTGQLPRMEELFTQLEALDRFYSKIGRNVGPHIRRYRKALNEFPAVTAAFFGALFRNTDGSHVGCKTHGHLAKALNAGDAVITFNYDCLMDHSLRQNGGNSWDSRIGYGVKVERHTRWSSEIGAGRRATDSIRLLKMHGSLNWRRSSRTGGVSLRADPYSNTDRTNGEIVPPVWNKTIEGDAVLTAIWKEARARLAAGTVMIVIGYSVPQTDLLTQALIRTTSAERTSRQKLSHLILVNPSSEDRAKFVGLVRPALTSETLILELENLNALSRLIRQKRTSTHGKPPGAPVVAAAAANKGAVVAA